MVTGACAFWFGFLIGCGWVVERRRAQWEREDRERDEAEDAYVALWRAAVSDYYRNQQVH